MGGFFRQIVCHYVILMTDNLPFVFPFIKKLTDISITVKIIKQISIVTARLMIELALRSIKR